MKIFLLALVFTASCNLMSAQITLPANMYADTAHAPFLHGVASGDPPARQDSHLDAHHA